jgi:pimeloyl-ACP methyl ester carboxylesterase
MTKKTESNVDSMNERIEKMSNNNNPIQEPKPPFPYHVKEVAFENKAAGITLAGTFTVPSDGGPFPAVMLISGMGPYDRDATTETGKKAFLVLADYLTRRGIAVLRVDKRGIGKSTGTYDLNVTSQDLADDVLAGVMYLKSRTEINPHKIGLIGHSEGGMIAPMVAARSSDVAFLVSLAGVASTGISALEKQTELQLRADGASEELIKRNVAVRPQLFFMAQHEPDLEKADKLVYDAMMEYWDALPLHLQQESLLYHFAITDENALHCTAMINSPWYRFFLAHNPAKTLEQIKIPVLALNGSRDFIITADDSLPIIAAALEKAGNTDYETVELPGLNHRFQHCVTGSLAELATIDETIASEVLDVISAWILKRTA